MSAGGCDVVLVEAEPGIARALATALERRGHRVRRAEGTEEALALPDPDVLVAVLGAPGGLELLAEARRRGRLARAVLLSGDASPSCYGRALELGACDVLRRPVELPELVRAVESAASPRESELRLSLPAEERACDFVAREVLAFALRRGVGPAARARMASAAAELVENAAQHAYPSGRGPVEIALRVGEREASVRVRDRGRGFDVEAERDRARRARTLAGIERARALCEDLELWSEAARGTTALLRFGVYRADFDGGPSLDLTDLDYLLPRTADELVRALRHDPEGFELVLPPALAVLVGRLLSAPLATASPRGRFP